MEAAHSLKASRSLQSGSRRSTFRTKKRQSLQALQHLRTRASRSLGNWKRKSNVDARSPYEVVLLERGLGLDCGGVVVSYHSDCSSYKKLIAWIRQFTLIETETIDGSLIDLNDNVHYRTLTF